jgi:PAS domain S-box-containing protein
LACGVEPLVFAFGLCNAALQETTNQHPVSGIQFQVSNVEDTDVADKPTYEELEKRVRELEKEALRRKQAEEALRASEAQKRAILDASLDRIRYVDKDMRIIWGNRTTVLLHGMSPKDLVGRTCHEVFIGRDTPCEGCATVKARASGEIESALMYHPKIQGIDGETYWDTYCVPLKSDTGEVEGFIQIGRDITRRKLAQERIHTLSQELLKAQENERERISQYLHDHVGQELSLIKIGCETLLDGCSDVPGEISQRLTRLSKTVQGTITAVRGLAYDLRPPGLDQLGLAQAVFQLCEDFSANTGLKIDFQAAGMDDLRVDPDIEINLYRLFQEALNNIKKHADADHVIIRMVASYPNMILRIEDDGKGFDVEGSLLKASSEKRMGLGSMEERVSLLDGNLRIQSRLMEGTKIRIEIPLKEKTGA